jgi:signal transduction histidine kinase
MESQLTPAPATTPSAEAPKPPARVLIVDDEVMLGQMLLDTLEAYNFQAAFAENAEPAYKLMAEFKPTLALVDYNLGTITGFEVAKVLKSMDPNLPVILMTAYPSLDLAVKAIQSDIYDFLAKPVDKAYLLRSISKAIEKRTLTEENKRLIAHLQESNASLERMNQVKSKFLSIVTHDLRVPLTSVKGYTDMLKTEPDLPQDTRDKCFGAIERAADRMNGLISNLMDLVSIEAGKLRVELTPMNYLEVCKELQETMAPVALTKKVALEWELPPGPLNILGDSSRLVQVLSNLTSNAFKHTPEGGKITVKVSTQDGMVLSEVIDTGAGIAAEDQKKIFEQFYQVESSAARRQGLGLGLNITQEIITAHQGKIGCTSEGLGKGSRFWFTIPIQK